MFALLSLFFLMLPIALMLWMALLQRRMRNRRAHGNDEPILRAPWEEQVMMADGLVYSKKFDPNEQLADAEAHAEDMKTITILGVGL